MQFSSIITSLIAATAVSAVATPQQESHSRRAVKDIETSAASELSKMEAAGCDVFGE